MRKCFRRAADSARGRTLGQGGRKVAGQEKRPRPEAVDVGPGAKVSGPVQVGPGGANVPVAEVGAGPGEMEVPAGLDGGQE